MKLTKSRLQQIIKEELKIVLEGDNWYSDEYETRADRKYADRPDVSSSGRPFRTGVPPEDVLKHGADLEKYPTTDAERESDRIAHALEVEWIRAGNDLRDLGYVDSEILDIAMAVRDGDMEMDDALEQVRTLREGKADAADKKSTEPKGATKAEKAEDTRRKRRSAKQALKET